MNSVGINFITSAQKFNEEGSCWGRKLTDIMIGDKFKHGYNIHEVKDVRVTPNGKPRIIVTYAHKFLNGGKQTGEEWFNQDAEILWL